MSAGDVISTDETVAADGAATMAVAETVVGGERSVADSGAGNLELPTIDPARYARGAEIARGGMGRIIEARDRRLGRDLAIKELLARSPELERRFEREMKITARLQHPAIIAVHDAGRWPSGDAFYTMKQVDGQPLDTVIAANQTLRERLAFLPNVLAVADALAYAHSRQVIHRDLKPANVLVGAFGETVVIDWGLAKDLGRDEDDEPLVAGSRAASDEGLTVVGEALGTPAYMPPEQARGESVDARADVYSLGALLYHLLAGRMPYADQKSTRGRQLVELVKSKPPTALAALEADIPADLLAIVAKAMAREPAERYPTARGLAEDLKRFATGQLVGAYDYSTWALTRRWVGRHRGAVFVAAVMAVVLAVGGALAFWRITRERDRAEAQRTLAEQNRGEVEELLDFMLVDLRERLAPLGQLPLLDLVVKKADQYYQRRPVDWSRPGDPEKRALALITLGDVRRTQGDLVAALAAYQRSLAISQPLAASDPTNASWQRDLSVAQERVGGVSHAQGDLAAALAAYRRSLAISQPLAASDPFDPDRQRDLSVSHNKVGKVLRDQGELAAALAAYREGLAISERLAASDPTNAEWQRDLSISHQNLGDVLHLQGDLTAALVAYRKDLAITEELTASDPTHAAWQRDLCVSHSKVGDVLRAQGELTAALVAYRKGLAISERLAASDPTHAGWQRDLFVSHQNLGDVLGDQGDLTAALVAYRKGLAISERLAASDPINAGWQRDLSVSHGKVAEVLEAQGDLAAALAAYREGFAIRKRLWAQDPTNAGWQRDLARCHLAIGGILEQMGEKDVAGEHMGHAGMLYESSAANAGDFYDTACAYGLSGNLDKAFEMLDRAVEEGWQDPWTEKDPDLASLRDDPRWKPLIERMKTQK